MSGSSETKLVSILNILTPSDIEVYLGFDEAVIEDFVPLAAGAEELSIASHEASKSRTANSRGESASEAKVIPLHKKEKDFNTSVEDEKISKEESYKKIQDAYAEDEKSVGLESIGVVSAKKLKAIYEQEEKEQRSKQSTASVFLISQREILKETVKKMSGQNALDNYKQSDAVNRISKNQDVESIEELDNTNSPSQGVLLNKKHS